MDDGQQFPNGQPIISSGFKSAASSGNDVILASSNNNASKKKIIIVAVAVALAVIILGVILFITLRSTSSDNNPKQEEQAETSSVRSALQKLFEVSDELSIYEATGLARIYVEENYVAVQSQIDVKLSALNRQEIEYIVEYVDSMTDYVALIGEAIEIYYVDGCQGETVEDLSACELSEESERDYLWKLEDAQIQYDHAQYAVEAARRYYENGGGSE